MATLVSKASGNLTNAATWAPLSAVSGAELDVETSTSGVTTSIQYSTTFVLANAAVDGVLVKLQARGASGQITIKLANNTSPGVREASVTVNVSDLPNITNSSGWVMVTFASVTPNGTDAYKIGLVTDATASGAISFWRDTTVANWSRGVRLATTQAPVANDKLIMVGGLSGAGAMSSYVITMDSTATTSYGPTASGGPPQGVSVSLGATFQYGVAPSTNYYFRVKGVFGLLGGGIFNIGTSGTPIPASSTAVLEFDSLVNVDSGLLVDRFSTCNIYGNPRASVWGLLGADAAAGATTLTFAAAHNLSVGDVIGIAPTTRTNTQFEQRTVLTVPTSTTVTVAALTNAHSGTSPTQAEVVFLSRNVIVRGISSSLQGYVNVSGFASSLVWRYAEFTWLGSATGNKRGIDIVGGTLAFDIQYCSFHDYIVTSSLGVDITVSANTSPYVFSNNVLYNIQNTAVTITATTGTWTMDGNLVVGTGGNPGYSIGDHGGTFTNNWASGCNSFGVNFAEQAPQLAGSDWSGNVAHSNGNAGFTFTNSSQQHMMSNCKSWRNAGAGIVFTGLIKQAYFYNWLIFGNAGNTNLTFVQTIGVIFDSCTIAADSSFPVNQAFQTSTIANIVTGLFFINCSFGVVSGIFTSHANQTIGLSSTTNGQLAFVDWVLINCTFGDANIVSTVNLTGSMLPAGSKYGQQGSAIRLEKVNGVATDNRTYGKYGSYQEDTVTFRTAGPSQKITPYSAAGKTECGSKQVLVPSGATASVTVYVNKSASYNGAQPRLVLKANPIGGIAADVVLATASGGTGSWLPLTGTIPAVTDDAVLDVVVDCDGTAGTVNVSDWSAAGGGSMTAEKFWKDGSPVKGYRGGSAAGLLALLGAG